MKLLIGKYEHEKWLEKIKGYEEEPERGERCKICYQDRLDKTAQIAQQEKINSFATTLSISPYKDTEVINKIGNKIADKYKLIFLEKDFKKNDGFKKSATLSRKLNLYRQNYCGCEFSRR